MYANGVGIGMMPHITAKVQKEIRMDPIAANQKYYVAVLGSLVMEPVELRSATPFILLIVIAILVFGLSGLLTDWF